MEHQEDTAMPVGSPKGVKAMKLLFAFCVLVACSGYPEDRESSNELQGAKSYNYGTQIEKSPDTSKVITGYQSVGRK